MATDAQKRAEELYEYYYPRLENLSKVIQRILDEYLVQRIKEAADKESALRIVNELLKALKENAFDSLISIWEKSVKMLKGEKDIAKFDLRSLQAWDVTKMSEALEQVRAAMNKLGQAIINASKQMIASPRLWAHDIRWPLQRIVDHDLRPVAQAAAEQFAHLRRAY